MSSKDSEGIVPSEEETKPKELLYNFNLLVKIFKLAAFSFCLKYIFIKNSWPWRTFLKIAISISRNIRIKIVRFYCLSFVYYKKM